MDISKLENLVRSLSEIPWEWEESDFHSVLLGAGYTPESTNGTRASYSNQNEFLIDAYCRNGQMRWVEISIADKFVDEDDPDSYQSTAAEFDQAFATAEEAIRNILGAPTYTGIFESENYPEDEDALRTSIWPLNNARLMLQIRQEGSELPFRLLIAIDGKSTLTC